MKKAAIITFLSVSKESNEAKYTVAGSNQVITGSRTNDAPVKYLLNQSNANGNPVSRIACIVSREVYASNQPDSGFQQFQNMINHNVSHQVDFIMIPYDFSIQEDGAIETIDIQQDKALSVYRGMTGALEGYDEVYIDYTGGFRDTSFLTTVLIRYLEFINITCREIVYSNFTEKKLYSISYIYDMFQLLNAVSQFVETGSGKLLHSIYNSVSHEPTKHLVKCIQKFSHVIQLCNIKEVDHVIEELTESMRKLEENPIETTEPDIQLHVFRELLHVVKKKFYLEGENTSFTYPRLIKWCIDNGLLQQALILYTEKMPIAYSRAGLIKILPNQEKGMPGSTVEANNLYTSICKDILDKTDRVNEFKILLNSVKEEHTIYPDLSKNIRYIQNNCTDEHLKAALGRILKFLNSHYYGNDYEYRNVHSINWSYCDIPIRETNGKSFLNTLSNKPNLIYAFIWDDVKKAKAYKERTTNEKKIIALEHLSELKDISKYSDTLSKEELKNIIIYYLAVKHLRNQISHAVETKPDKGEKILTDYLHTHNLKTDLTIENIQTLISDGLHLTNPELF